MAWSSLRVQTRPGTGAQCPRGQHSCTTCRDIWDGTILSIPWLGPISVDKCSLWLQNGDEKLVVLKSVDEVETWLEGDIVNISSCFAHIFLLISTRAVRGLIACSCGCKLASRFCCVCTWRYIWIEQPGRHLLSIWEGKPWYSRDSHTAPGAACRFGRPVSPPS